MLYNVVVRKTALLDIFDSSKQKVMGFAYSGQNVDLVKMLIDVDESAVIGDRIRLEFEYDTVARVRIRNFLAIMQLYDFAFKYNPNKNG
jgi:hypothetical protein